MNFNARSVTLDSSVLTVSLVSLQRRLHIQFLKQTASIHSLITSGSEGYICVKMYLKTA